MITDDIIRINDSEINLQDRLVQLVEIVKNNPQSIDARFALCKMYMLQADWDRALQQLDILFQIESEVQQQYELYKNLIFSERMRELVLAGKKTAGSLGKPHQQWINSLHQANALYQQGQYAEGESMRMQALSDAEPRSGRSAVWGAFNWLADGDDRLGPVCEFICAGGYHWVPFAEMQALEISAPQKGSDLVWAPAEITFEEQTLRGYIPARYPVVISDSLDMKIGTKTEWQKQGDGRYIGSGRKMWVSDNGEFSLFEIGRLGFEGESA
ncbi:hypothetical protein BL250_17680 [Erwinia sp. OLTSP20]|uniref:type VI secretion system accessory protein TagJ n=1 Tax=unclassified Erwinia TaxID=2622719 RepID=UPI000C19BF85|nr:MULTISPECIES: type VI secretion system accessory protein TagJ [unclassified Erwinia]PIJ48302.1 hypothetical protein BV501_17745 [Erwinia sp. OAMSP11]PIJ71619.1 hypothetical protein BK416_11435 [Erwinia sp. OLSSP12]PIJ82689.1 hypothetical protein BLD47_06200 [Erwinia sp. OLCASP19]PIJ83156.1 hypothetical protein BLD46_10295 [Erwinia sp. OLMTSP26]PIJ85322.1 hypothetical protein BLD49_10855 [Erwinia sp. OLMDSP33]